MTDISPIPFGQRPPAAKVMFAAGLVLMLVGLWVIHVGLAVVFVGLLLLTGSRELSEDPTADDPPVVTWGPDSPHERPHQASASVEAQPWPRQFDA